MMSKFKKIQIKAFGARKRVARFLIFLRGFIEYNVISHFKPLPPRKMIINLTYKCNSKCIMCNIWKIRPKDELTVKDWKRILRDPIFEKIEDLTISGGEAILYKDFEEVSDLFVKNMPKLKFLGIISNGFNTSLLLRRVSYLLDLCKKRNVFLSVSVSLDGVGEIHDKIRRIRHGFIKVKASLIKLKRFQQKYNFSLGCGILILRQNLKSYKKIAKLLDNLGIYHSYQIVGFHGTFVDNLESKNKVDFRKSDKKSLKKFLKDQFLKVSFFDFKSYYWKDLLNMYFYGKKRTTPCPFLKDQFVLDSFGDVYYCLSEKKIGNVKKSGNISELYFSQSNIKQLMKKRSCPTCNSGCDVSHAISSNLFKYLWFKITNRVWFN